MFLESFSQAGVPCFMADMKGGLSGISQAGKYDQIVDRENAFEVLLAQSEQESAAQAQAEATAKQEKEAAKQAKQVTSTAVRSLTRGILGNLLK